MKTTRRQELRTNELSQQIEQVRNSLKENATTITAVVVVVAALSFGGYWYYGQQSSRLEDAYSQLGQVSAGDEPADRLKRFQAVAREQINPTLTVTAWSRVGDLALSLLTAPANPAVVDPANPTDAPAPPPDREELIPAAEEAFTNVLAQATDDPLARGHAMIAMGVLDENRRQFEKARQWYEKVLADDRLKDLPFQSEAEFRLAGLKTWSKPADFPPPPPMVLVSPQGQPITLGDVTLNAPAASLPAATSMPMDDATTTTQAASENQASSPQPPADSPAPGAAPSRPTPTTQPAAGD